MIYLLLVLVAGTPGPISLRTDITKPLTKNNVALDSRGRLYLFDPTEGNIFVSENDSPFKTVARGLAGNSMRIIGDSLYILDSEENRVLNLEGTVLEKQSFGQNQALPMKAGWLLKTDTSLSPPYQILWRDSSGKSSTVLEWSQEDPYFAPMTPDHEMPINPATDHSFFVTDQEGRYAYIRLPKTDILHVFDATQHKIVKQFRLAKEAVPFNTQWGDRFIAHLKKRTGNKIKIVPNYPSHFPAVRRMFAGPDFGVAVFAQGRNGREELFLFDQAGPRAPSLIDIDNFFRILAVSGDRVYLGMFDEEKEQAYICITDWSQVQTLVANNPINQDWPGSRTDLSSN